MDGRKEPIPQSISCKKRTGEKDREAGRDGDTRWDEDNKNQAEKIEKEKEGREKISYS